jgi:hypothetical protein
VTTIDHATLARVAARLAASNFDLAAGLREDELNNFLTAHYHSQSSGGHPAGVYVGQGSLADLGLTYSYSIGTPIAIALAPLSAQQFGRIMQSWMAAVPELAALGTPHVLDAPPPNVQLRASSITLTIAAADGSINPPATLVFSLSATGFVTVSTAGGQATVTIVPIDIRLDNPGAFATALAELTLRLGFRTNAPANTDCVPLQKLILHIVNAVIAPKLSSFIQQFHFPVPIHLFSGVEVTSVSLDIVDKLLVLLANVSSLRIPKILTQIEISASSPSDAKIRANEITAAAEASYSRIQKELIAPINPIQEAASFPNRGLFLLMSQRFFQTLASALLVTSASNQGSGGGTIYYRWWWSIRTWNPITKIVGNGLSISIDIQGSAGAQVGVHTHCGDVTASVNASASALPARADTTFYFQNQSRELWMRLAPKPFTLSWTIGGLPWPLNQVLAIILDLFTDLGVAFIAALGLRWNLKLTDVPDSFPGTQLQYDLNLDQNVVADPNSGALLVAGTVTFKP